MIVVRPLPVLLVTPEASLERVASLTLAGCGSGSICRMHPSRNDDFRYSLVLCLLGATRGDNYAAADDDDYDCAVCADYFGGHCLRTHFISVIILIVAHSVCLSLSLFGWYLLAQLLPLLCAVTIRRRRP